MKAAGDFWNERSGRQRPFIHAKMQIAKFRLQSSCRSEISLITHALIQSVTQLAEFVITEPPQLH